MKLWLISRKDYDDLNDYDIFTAFVVAAETSFKARAQASNHDHRNHNIWLDARNSLCTCIAESTKFREPQVVLSSFNAG